MSDFDREVISCIGSAKGRIRHAARHALHHLERAWLIKNLDPEMAAFRAITAEEEAATGLMLALRDLRYENANRLNFRRHDHKAAVFPFLHAVWIFFSEVGPSLPFVPQLAATTVGGKRVLELRLRFGDNKIGTPIPPLNFSIDELEAGLPYRFEKQLSILAQNTGKNEALDHINEVANLRNILLYAGNDGWATVANEIDGVIIGYQKRVFILLKVLCLVFPYREKALFVQQCIDAFLVMMGLIEDQREEATGGSVGGLS